MNLLTYLGIEEQAQKAINEQRDFSANTLHRIELPISECNILSLLVAIDTKEKYYWQNDIKDFECLCGHNLNSDGAYDNYSTENVRHLSVRRFNKKEPLSSEWSKFNNLERLIPLWSIERNDDKYSFVINLSAENLDTANELLDTLSIGNVSLSQLNRLKYNDINELITLDKWRNSVNSALNDIKQKKYEKIVLARRKTLTLSEGQNTAAFFAELCIRNINTYNFYLQVDENNIFFGNSPEKLFKTDGKHFETEALAGSFSDSEEVDEKIISENHLVVRYLKERLPQILKPDFSVDESKNNCKKLNYINHLQIAFHGTLSKPISGIQDINSIADLLMPTPAVNGYPKEATIELIPKFEGFARGAYAGAVACIFANKAEFCVPLRSALMHNNNLHLYAGAGIVSGSVPDEEWKEIDNKFQNFTNFLERQ